MKIRTLIFVEKMGKRIKWRLWQMLLLLLSFYHRKVCSKLFRLRKSKTEKLVFPRFFSLEQYFRVSHQSVLFRLRHLNFMTEETLQSMLKIIIRDVAPQYGIFDMSLYEKGNENVILSDYGFRAKFLFDNEIISESHYNQLMKLISDVKKEG